MKIHIHNLGCDKNKVDGEKLAGRLEQAGFKILPDSEKADLIIVNTCGFIGPAKEESLETAFSFIKAGQKVAMAGCLAQRYSTELKKQIPEVDLVLGLADTETTFRKIISHYGKPRKAACQVTRRLLTGPRHTAPLKIAEGCSNRCSYCAIPLIRGKQVSRPEKEILEEARRLRSLGVKELILVAQDITAYGGRKGLPGLLRKLCRLSDSFEWIRLMYCHPAGVTDEFMDVMAGEERVLKYIDLPLQHISDDLLKRMNRHYTRAQAETLIRKLRDRIPGVAIRTTFINGFPGETARDFDELRTFVKETEFDRMGAFAFSPEEDTRAFRFSGHVSPKTSGARVEELMYIQSDIIFRKNSALIGKTLPVLIDEQEDDILIGRTTRDAPEVDCNVIVRGADVLTGGLYRLKIKDAVGLDLYA